MVAIIAATIPSSVFADEYENTLLWRIDGNGLSKPSYVFGTIHLTKKELFKLGDSVYNALETTEGFATELDINELAVNLINEAFNNITERGLEEKMSRQEREKYGELLKKKFKKPLKDITSEDLIKYKNDWLNNYLKEGEMETILDVHLYTIATSLGKFTTGIEDIEDQMRDVTTYDIKNIVASEEMNTLEKIIEICKMKILMQ